MTGTPSTSARLPRVPFERQIQLSLGPHSERRRAANLSLGGMCLLGASPQPLGVRLSVALDNGEQAIPLGVAEVVWQDDARFGVRFVLFSAKAERLIEALVRHGGATSRPPLVDREAPTKPGWTGPLPDEPKTLS